MNCSEVEEKLLLAESGELAANEKLELESHLSQCASGRHLASRTRALLEAGGPAPQMPESLQRRILTAVRAQARKPAKPSIILKLLRDFGAAAAVSAAAIVLFFLIAPPARQPASPSPPTPVARETAPGQDETARTIARDLRRTIRQLDSTRASALGEDFTTQLEKFRDSVEATRFMLTTPGKSGLEKQIGTVKGKIQTLKEKMTAIALYTEKRQEFTN